MKKFVDNRTGRVFNENSWIHTRRSRRQISWSFHIHKKNAVRKKNIETDCVPSRCERNGDQSKTKFLSNGFGRNCSSRRNEKSFLSEFLQSFREKSAHFISSAYLISSQNIVHRSVIDGFLFTTLAEDVFTLVYAQLELLDGFLTSTNLTITDTGEAVLVNVLLSIIRIVLCKQMHYGRSMLFLQDLDSCIARANDYWIMGEKTSDMMLNVSKKYYNHLTWKAHDLKTGLDEWGFVTSLVKQEASNLIDQLNSDAVEASHHVAIFIIQVVHRSDIPHELFSRHWEEDLTNNEVARYIVRVFANYLPGIEDFLVTPCLYHKVLITLVRCTICFYLKCFVLKASRIRISTSWRNKTGEKFFRNPRRALMRMTHDIQVFETFFQKFSAGNVALTKIIGNEFSSFCTLLFECSSYALGGNSLESLSDFIIVIHKRTGANLDITRHFLSDVFTLMGQKQFRYEVRDIFSKTEGELRKIDECIEGEKNMGFPVQERSTESVYFQLDEMLKSIYEERILQEKATFCGTIKTIF